MTVGPAAFGATKQNPEEVRLAAKLKTTTVNLDVEGCPFKEVVQTLQIQTGINLYIDPLSFQYLEDTEIDYVEGVHGSGFKFNNPQVTGSCGCGSSVKF